MIEVATYIQRWYNRLSRPLRRYSFDPDQVGPRPVFAIGGTFGWGDLDPGASILPFFGSIAIRMQTLSIGPFEQIDKRAQYMIEYIRQEYPRLSPEFPIDLIGQSMGAQCIMYAIVHDPEFAKCIAHTVFISPCMGGIHYQDRLINNTTGTMKSTIASVL
jgi:hypothetical protein